MTKHTNIYLDSASRRQRGLLSTRTPSGPAATIFGLAVDQRGWPTLWRLKSSGIRAVFIVGRTKGLSRFARVPEVLERLRNIVVP